MKSIKFHDSVAPVCQDAVCGAIAVVTAHSLQAIGRIHREEKLRPTPDSLASEHLKESRTKVEISAVTCCNMLCKGISSRHCQCHLYPSIHLLSAMKTTKKRNGNDVCKEV